MITIRMVEENKVVILNVDVGESCIRKWVFEFDQPYERTCLDLVIFRQSLLDDVRRGTVTPNQFAVEVLQPFLQFLGLNDTTGLYWSSSNVVKEQIKRLLELYKRWDVNEPIPESAIVRMPDLGPMEPNGRFSRGMPG